MAEESGLAGRTAVVTGAGGFIGAALCRRLARAGAEVSGLDANPAAQQRIREAGAEPRLADVTDAGAVALALDGADLVLHAAAIVSDAGTMETHVKVNVGGTVNVLAAAESAGVDRVLHVSSVVVYGYDDPGVQDENANLRTCGIPYIDTKSASDRLARRQGAIVVRPGDVYGPGSVPWSIRPAEMAKAGRLAVPGEGDGVMLPVYVDDLVDGILVALSQGEAGEAYTAWKDDEPVTFEEYLNRYSGMAGTRPARHLPRPLLRGVGVAMETASRLTGRPPEMTRHAVTLIDRRGSVSAGRLRSLGWEPRVGLDEGLARTEQWLRAEGFL
ncbi:MAG TPA: NAD-dependent epimerase/dehydratase family protein [Solirubrobacterales bacterium]|nr:NAD-dependent epimerase/dehydratase family protein [Solirubrobacterales bacterium]